MNDQSTDRDLKIFILIPILANIVTILAGIVVYNRGDTGAEAILLFILALVAPWVIGFFARRLIELFLDRETDRTDDGFV